MLRTLESHLDCDICLRGNVLTLEGDEPAVQAASAVVRELSELIEQGHEIAPGTIEAVQPGARPARVPVGDPRGRRLAPPRDQGRPQDGQPEALRRLDPRQHDHVRDRPRRHRQDLPRGRARRRRAQPREIDRIILTRPAVEAGERLGFLPGDLMAKVDPYLRPLFDALYDMLDPERATRYMERGMIEVAPLAFMRGRGSHFPVQSRHREDFDRSESPGGRFGDRLERAPTPVLGVYPQGRKPMFRVTTQDGASHSAAANTSGACTRPRSAAWQAGARARDAADGRSFAAFHQHRYELPLLSAPAQLLDSGTCRSIRTRSVCCSVTAA